MESITFNCRFITPAFLGGADPRGTPELRPPSIKGAVRFWWRAQCGLTDLKEIKEKEFKIFGGVDGDRAQRATFSIRLTNLDFLTSRELPRSSTEVRNKNFKINIFEYLAFGTYERENKANVLNRDFVKPGQEFKVTFIFYSQEYKEEIVLAFQLAGLFGGIGMKSRNGFGRFEIRGDTSALNWKSALKKLKAGTQKSFTSFSEKTLCFQTDETYENAEQAWAEIGKAYKNAREYIEKPHNYEDRSYISSPIIDNKRQKSFLDRHAKPYFLTVVPDGNDYRGLILFLPYLFLEDATIMLRDLFRQKEDNPGSTGIRIMDLKKILIQTPISKHQEYYQESNGFFHKELCHNDNPHALTLVNL